MARGALALSLLLSCIAMCIGAPARAQETARLRVVLVLDASGSMAGNDPGKVVSLASKMLAELTDERDHVTVLSFGSQIKSLKDGKGSAHDDLRAAIDTLGRSDACTDYAMALEAAAAQLGGAAPKGERRVVLFLTDGRFEPVEPNGTCGRFEGASAEIRRPIEERIEHAAKNFKAAAARVYTIGLGKAPASAADSARMLRMVADETGGRFVHAAGPRDVPRIFAGIFGVLIGAPVIEDALYEGHQDMTFHVPNGAERLHVLLVPEKSADLEKVSLSRGKSAIALEPIRREGRLESSYRLARVGAEAPGDYQLHGSGTGRMEVLVIPDVGLSLFIEDVAKFYAEGEKLAGAVALRTRTGDKVELAPEFLAEVKLTVAMGADNLLDQKPDREGAARFAAQKPLARGKYKISASVSHAQGFLEVPPVEHDFAVEPRFTMTVDTGTIRFDGMAEIGAFPLSDAGTVKLVAPADLPIDVTLTAEFPEDLLSDIDIEPKEIIFGPGKPREAEFKLSWRDARRLRQNSHHYQGAIRLVPDADAMKLLVGEREWKVPVDGRLREWTLRRWLEEYKWEIAIGIGVLLLLIYLVGRALAQTFPPKARIHYLEVGQEFESDSLVKRYARHGAYRHARFQFPLGKKARPLALFQSTGAGFTVIPQGNTITIRDDSVPEVDRERRKPFKGSWDQHYRLGDSYEVWLTRS